MGEQRIMHVALADDWEGCLRFGEYDVSTLATPFDDTGHIHATTRARLPGVLDRIYGHLTLPLLLVVLDERALTDAGIGVTWHPTGSGERVPRILGPFPMEAPIVVMTIPLERQDNHWIAPDLSSLSVRNHAPASP
ncbi:DUF952 domain-containing protein [Rhodococcus sp. NPDC056960]|uniref:DUF952 domain-containing protein n=1 Tax=Rhodococcus sp. NPDC056960 TaxID=3345982 RepID=UPI00362F24C4